MLEASFQNLHFLTLRVSPFSIFPWLHHQWVLCLYFFIKIVVSIPILLPFENRHLLSPRRVQINFESGRRGVSLSSEGRCSVKCSVQRPISAFSLTNPSLMKKMPICSVQKPISAIKVPSNLMELPFMVPADGVLISGHSLAVDESSMNGESKIVQKYCKRPFMMSGCKIVNGYGTMMVTGVGINTEWGLLMTSISEDNGEETTLQVRLNGVATFVGIVGLVVALFVLLVILVRLFGALIS